MTWAYISTWTEEVKADLKLICNCSEPMKLWCWNILPVHIVWLGLAPKEYMYTKLLGVSAVKEEDNQSLLYKVKAREDGMAWPPTILVEPESKIAKSLISVYLK